MKHSFNIVPFRTISLFIKGYINNIVSFKCMNFHWIDNQKIIIA